MKHDSLLKKIVTYRTDGRNGLVYDLPAIITCTQQSHPGDYPEDENGERKKNPLPVPESEDHVHLTVLTPGGGFGTQIVGPGGAPFNPADEDFIGAADLKPGSGSYVEWNVPQCEDYDDPQPRTWR